MPSFFLIVQKRSNKSSFFIFNVEEESLMDFLMIVIQNYFSKLLLVLEMKKWYKNVFKIIFRSISYSMQNWYTKKVLKNVLRIVYYCYYSKFKSDLKIFKIILLSISSYSKFKCDIKIFRINLRSTSSYSK